MVSPEKGFYWIRNGSARLPDRECGTHALTDNLVTGPFSVSDPIETNNSRSAIARLKFMRRSSRAVSAASRRGSMLQSSSASAR